MKSVVFVRIRRILLIAILSLLSTGLLVAGTYLFLPELFSPLTKILFHTTQKTITPHQGVLADETEEKGLIGELSFNIPAIFNDTVTINARTFIDNAASISGSLSVGDTVTIDGDVIVNNHNLTLGTGELTASNVIYSLTAGDNITITGGQNAIISATATTLQGLSGDLTLVAGEGISIEGLSIINDDPGSAQDIFKTIDVDGTTFSASGNTDTLTFTAGSGISLSADTSGKEITIAASGGSGTSSQWTTSGSNIYYNLGNVGIGNTNPTATLHVTGTSLITGAVTLSNLSTGIVHSNSSGLLSSSALNLAGGSSEVTGTLPAGNGGTGDDTSATTGVAFVSSGDWQYEAQLAAARGGTGVNGSSASNGQLLIGNGSGYTLATLTAGSGVSITNGSGSITISSSGGAGGSQWTANANGTFYPTNSGLDVIFGGTSTASAKFAFINTNSGTPTASISANSGNNAAFLTGGGNLATTNNQTLTIGGSSTGNITLSPIGGAGTVLSTGSLNLASGKVFQINGTDVLSSSTLGSGVINSSLTSVGTLTTGTWNASVIGAQYGGTGDNTSATTGVPYISAGNWQYEAQLSTSRGGTGLDTSAASNGQLLIGNGTGLSLATLTAGSGISISNSAGGITISQSGSGSSKWTESNGTLTPNNNTLDVLIGGTATSSAKFAVLNMNSGTPTASVSAGATGGIYLASDGTIQTTLNKALTIGGNTTGDITLSPLGGAGTVTSTGNLNLSSGKTYQINGTNVLTNTTLGSGVINSSLTSVGTLTSGTWNATAIGAQYGGTGINTSASTGVPSISGGTWSVNAQLPLSLGGTGSNLTAVSGGIVYSGASGLAISAAGTTGQCLASGGTGAPTWTSCSTGTSFWNQANGALSPINSTVDLLVGGTASSSAKFAVLNVNSGTPTASVSAGSAGAAYLTAAGTLQTTANQTLVLGGNTTGNITLSPLNGSGIVNSTGDLNLSAGKTFQINGTTVLSNNTLGSGVINSSLTSVGTLTSGTWNATAIGAQYGGTGDDTSATTGVPYIAAGNWQYEAALDETRGGTGLSSYTTGDLIYASGSNTLATRAIGSSGQILTVSGGVPTWADAGGTINFWQRANGAVAPYNITDDLLLGSTATSSAKFAFINNAGGTPTASISGDITLNSIGNIQTTQNQQLTIGGNSTGTIILSPLNGAGTVFTRGTMNLLTGKTYQIGGVDLLSSTTLGSTVVNSSLTSVGALASGSIASGFGTIATSNTITGTTINGTTGINTGASSGTQRIDASGNLVNIGTIDSTYLDTTTNTVNLAASTVLQFNGTTVIDASRNLNNIAGVTTSLNPTAANTYNLGTGTGNQYNTIYGNTIFQNGNQVCDLSGNCSGLTTTFWDQTNGALRPKNSTVDLLVGGQASTSAKFAVLNVNSGTPTASLSAGTTGGSYLTAAGTVQTTANQTLTLGGDTTGNIALSPRNGSGTLALNAGTLTINGATGATSASPTCVSITNGIVTGTGACGSGSGGSVWTLNATDGTLYPINSTLDVLFGGTASSSAKFAFKNIAGGTPTASVSANSGNNAVFLTGDGNLATTNNQSLSIGGASTGNITLNPLNGSGTVTSTGNLNLSPGKVYQINGTTVLSNNTLGSGVTASSLTSVGTLTSGTWNATAIGAQYGGTGDDTSATTGVPYISAGNWQYEAQLNVARGGTGVDASAASNGQVLIGNGTGFSLANLTAGTGISITNGAGSITIGQTSTGSSKWTQSDANGILSPNNNTLDLLVGGTSTASAKFAVLNVAGGTPTASVSAGATGGIYLAADGTIQTTLNKTLTLGGGTTGNITLSPLNGAGTVTSTGNLNLSSGKVFQINGTNVLSATTLGSGVTASSLTSVGTLTSGTWNATAIGAQYGGTGDDTSAITGVPYISAGNWQYESALDETRGGTGLSSYTTGDLIYASGANTLATRAIGSSGQILTVSGGVPTWTDAGGTINFWQRNSGAVTPLNVTDDLLLGATSTSSAKIAFTNVAGGTPTASISANSGNNAVFLTGAGNLATTNNQSLTLGGPSTGNITLNPLNGSGTVNSTGDLNLSSGKSYQINGTTVLSSGTLGSGVTASSLTSVGTLTSGTWNATAIGAQYGGTGINTSASTGVPSISSGTWSVNAQLPLSLGGTNANLTAVNGGIVYSNASALAISAAGNSGQCLLSGGAGAPTWGNCTTGGGTNFWNQTNGSLSPINSTVDLLVGGTASSSAKFAVLNVNSGTPTASVSAGTAGAAYLTADGNLQTTAQQTLTLGGSTTGNITLSPRNGSGTVLSTGDLNLSSGKVFQINGTSVLSSSTLGTGVTASSLTSVGTLTSGTWNATAIGAQYGGTGDNTSATTGVPYISAGNWQYEAQLNAARGGTGLDGSSASNGQLLIGNGAGFSLANLTAGTGISITNGAGSITISQTGSGASKWTQNDAAGTLTPNNNTLDVLIGGTATSSAKFAVLNVAGGTPTASLSAGAAGGSYLSATGTLQTTANQTLTIGGNTTGNITLSPLNGSGTVLSTGTLNLASGKTYQINGTDVLSSSTLGSGVTASSLTSVGTLTSGTWNATAIGAQYGGTGINTSASTGVPSISSGTWSVNAQLPLSLGGTNANLTAVNGGIVYSNASALAISAAGNSGQCLLSGGAGAPTWGNCTTGGGTNFWNQTNGTLSPINSTVDLLVGGSASSSAKFAVLNVNSGTPTASVSAGTAGAAYLTADGNLQTTAQQTLTLGGSTTGNITLSPRNGSGTVLSTGDLNLSSGKTYQINGTSVLSATTLGSGVTGSSLTSVGTIATGTWQATAIGAQYGGTGINTSASTGVPSISGGTWSVNAQLPLSLGGTNANLTAVNGGIVYSNASALAISAAGNSGQCLLSGGAGAPTWGDCATGTNFWNQANGALSPINSTVDLLVGGTASSSAKFGFINVNSGTPTASISANSGANATTLSGLGVLGTTNKQTLSLGNTTTGDVKLIPGGTTALTALASGNVGIGTTAPGAKLNIEGGEIWMFNSEANPRILIGDSGTSGQYGYLQWQSDNEYYRIETDGTNGFKLKGNNVSIGNIFPSEPLLVGAGATELFRVDDSGSVSVANASPVGKFNVGGAQTGKALTILDENGDQNILTGSASGTTRFSFDRSGNLNIVGGAYQIGGTSVLSSTTLGSGVTASSLTSVGTIATGTWQATAIGTAYGGLGANVTAAGAGEILYSTATTTYDSLAAGNSGQCLLSGGAGAPTWGSCTTGGGTNWWDQTNGALYPINSTVDFLVGGQASTSAKFAVLNVNNGTPTASLSAGAAGGSYLTATGTLQTTANQTLTLGGNSTGNIILSPLNGSGKVGIGNTSPIGKLDLSGAVTGKALAIFNETGNQAIFTASASGTTRFVITNAGNVGIGTGSPGDKIDITRADTTTAQNLRFSTTSGTDWTIGQTTSTSDLRFWNDNLSDYPLSLTTTGKFGFGTGNTSPVGLLDVSGKVTGKALTILNETGNQNIFSASASGTPVFNITRSGTLELLESTGGTFFGTIAAGNLSAARTWTLPDETGTLCIQNSSSCGFTTGTNLWSQSNGTLYPINSTVDLLVGGQASTSAKFAALNMNSGTPTASLSAGTAGGVYLTATGKLATTARQDLTLGDNATTGNINLFGGSGIGAINATVGLFSDFIVNQAVVGERFRIDADGGVGIGTSSPDQELDVLGDIQIKDAETQTKAYRFRTNGSNLDLEAGGAKLYISNWSGADFTGTQRNYLVLESGANIAQALNAWQWRTGADGTTRHTIDGTTGTSVVFNDNAEATNFTIEGDTDTSLFFADGTNDRVGIGTGSPLAKLDVRGGTGANSGTVPVASVSGQTARAAMVVDQTGVGDVFTASKSGKTFFTVRNNGVIQMGNTTNGLTFDYINGGPTYTGSARMTKQIALSPEYNGAVLTASGSSTTNGQMTSDASPSANFRTYYQWTSSQTSLQDYQVAVRVTLPADFSSWAPGGAAMQVNYNTALTTNNTNKLDVLVYNPTSSASVPVVYKQAQTSSTAKTWTTVNISATELNGATSWNTASQSATIYLKMYAKDNNYVQIGDIILNYLSKF